MSAVGTQALYNNFELGPGMYCDYCHAAAAANVLPTTVPFTLAPPPALHLRLLAAKAHAQGLLHVFQKTGRSNVALCSLAMWR